MKTIPILAIDAGGTSCRAALCDQNGKILSYVKGASCNLHNIGIEKTQNTLIKVLQELAKPFPKPLQVKMAVVGMAALDTKTSYQVISNILTDAFQKCLIKIDDVALNNDGFTTLLGILGERPGLLVISGTGSIVCGKDEKGKLKRVGGWGHLVGDEGSGYSIGKAALRHIFRAYDEQDQPSILAHAVLKTMKLTSIDELFSWVYSDDYSVDQVASLAKVVSQAAHQGDQIAINLLDSAAVDLAMACETAIQKLGLTNKPFDIIVAGGVLQKDTLIFDKLLNLISKMNPLVKIVQMNNEPIYSAILIGLRQLNCDTEAARILCSQDLQRYEVEGTSAS